jgi:hypothetical protein
MSKNQSGEAVTIQPGRGSYVGGRGVIRGVRKVYYCPLCGWESFDKDSRGEPCGQAGCRGLLTRSRYETYDL